jgi:hypothetical protein
MLNALLVSIAAAVAVLLGYAATRPGSLLRRGGRAESLDGPRDADRDLTANHRARRRTA